MSIDTLVVGIGSAHGDDRVGWRVAEALQPCRLPHVEIRYAKSPCDLLNWLNGIRCLAICDACQGMGPVGSWHRRAWPEVDVGVVRPASSHALGLVDTLQLASRLDFLPKEVLVWSIEIAGYQANSPFSDIVAAAIWPVANDMVDVLTRGSISQTASPT